MSPAPRKSRGSRRPSHWSPRVQSDPVESRPLNRTSPLNTVMSVGSSPVPVVAAPVIPVSSCVPEEPPFVTHNPDRPLESTPLNSASPLKTVMSVGFSPLADAPAIEVSSCVPPPVPSVVHRPRWPAVSAPLNKRCRTVQNRDVGRAYSGRRRSADAGDLRGAARRPVGLPQPGSAARIDCRETALRRRRP